MGSRPDAIRRAVLIAAAIVLSAAAYYWTYGLFPIWELAWLAPLPILWLAPRLGGCTAAGTAFAAMAVAGFDKWSYYRLLHLPLWLSIAAVVEPAIVVALAVSLYRSFLCRGQPGRAVLAYPAVFVAAEYLFSLWQGTFGNTAYTQLRDLPVLQLGALTGIWGISFVVALAPAMAVAILALQGKPRRNMAIAFAAVAAVVLAYGSIRLATTPAAPSIVRVGLAESHVGPNLFPSTFDSTMNLMQGYADQARQLVAKGAKIVVLPEMTARVDDQSAPQLMPQIDAVFEQTARATGARILLGVLHVTGDAAYNEGRLYSPSGTIETVYRKHHLVPVAEGGTTPGAAISVLPQPEGTIGVQICRDMDYPELARRYGKQDVGLVLVPAWEFGPDYLWHGHMALMRAVEDGFSIVRSAKQGYLTVSDDRGRILDEKLTLPETSFATMLASVPVRHDPTLYQLWGDWFAWLDLALLAALLALWFTGLRRPA
ncbi:MAG TPA: nitrilase-related carbon-nitrogen hydrolase [Terracidiphilus sp.]|jgi:apolipoprotein N-acyltransferase|nr:nitrilase-related carbon-nitrogen hydrolase [Terracidiphilus sp.]